MIDWNDLAITALGSAVGVVAAGLLLGLLGFASVEEIAETVRSGGSGSNGSRYV